MRTHFVSNTLESAWLKALREIHATGEHVDDEEPFKEIRNLKVSYLNSFETDTEKYRQLFGIGFIEYMRKVYSPGGDPVSGRNYFRLIHEANGIDQVEVVVKKLTEEPLTRSATIVLAMPNGHKQPCVTEINFSIRNDLLHMSAVFKSSDFAKKFVPDMLELAAIHATVSRRLHVARGQSSAFIISAQLYNQDIPLVSAEMTRLKQGAYFKTDAIRENWDKEAESWDLNIENPEHYVNIEDGYARFLKFLDTVIPVSQPNHITALDSGCGTGVIAERLNKKGYDAVAIDISPKMLEFAHKDTQTRDYILANSLDIPYPDEHFDLIVSRGVLVSHVGKQYVDLFIQEHSRVLRTDGLFLFDFITHFEKAEVRERRNKAYLSYLQMKKKLESCGFTVLERSGSDANRVNAILCRKTN